MKRYLFLIAMILIAISCGNNPQKQKNAKTETETETVVEEYILEPGVTYVTETMKDTDYFGDLKEYNFEFTVYKDGSATCNIIETNPKSRKTMELKYEGSWNEVSKQDRMFLEIVYVIGSQEVTYFVDSSLNVYENKITSKPLKLTRKAE